MDMDLRYVMVDGTWTAAPTTTPSELINIPPELTTSAHNKPWVHNMTTTRGKRSGPRETKRVYPFGRL